MTGKTRGVSENEASVAMDYRVRVRVTMSCSPCRVSGGYGGFTVGQF